MRFFKNMNEEDRQGFKSMLWGIVIICVLGTVMELHSRYEQKQQDLYESKYDAYVTYLTQERFREAYDRNNFYQFNLHVKLDTVYNHSLGDEIEGAYSCNGSPVTDGSIITVSGSGDETLYFAARITEQDGIPDIGEATATGLSIPSADHILRYSNPLTKTCTVHVDEVGGRRYQGDGDFKVTFSLELRLPEIDEAAIDFKDVVNWTPGA